MFHKTFKKHFLHYKTFIFLGPEDVAVAISLSQNKQMLRRYGRVVKRLDFQAIDCGFDSRTCKIFHILEIFLRFW